MNELEELGIGGRSREKGKGEGGKGEASAVSIDWVGIVYVFSYFPYSQPLISSP